MVQDPDSVYHVLVIEDNLGDVHQLLEALQDCSLARMTLFCVGSLQDGIHHISANRIDAVLLDLGLPDCQGVSAITRIGAVNDHLPLIVLTGLDDEDAAREALRAGAQDYLIKGRVDGELLSRSIYYAIQRKGTEKKLRQKERELEHAQKMEGVGRLAGGVAHDFNNLLTSIHGYASLLRQTFDGDDRRIGDVEEIIKSAVRATDLTKQLTAFSRRESYSPVIIDLNEIVRDANAMLERMIGEDIELVVKEFEGLKFVRADKSQLDQVIMNLVVNARDAMPDGGRMVLALCNTVLEAAHVADTPEVRPGEYVELSVTDTGTGMDEGLVERIFEPFFTTKSTSEGTGLGLSIAYGIVKQNDGHIECVSQPGEGTRFRIYLPVIDEMPNNRAEVKDVKTPRGTETVLVIEDDAEVLSIIQKSLRPLGYRLLIASSGEEALAVSEAHEGQIHLVFSDVVLPDYAGPEVVRMLAGARPSMRVLFMSAYPGDTVVKRGLTEQDIPFLSKPFTPSEMGRKFREVLDAEESYLTRQV